MEITEKEKREALKHSYEDPYDDLLKVMQNYIDELTEPGSKYTPPVHGEDHDYNIEERVEEKEKKYEGMLELSKIIEEDVRP
jgi:hypothetical protein